jgi:hypothetical protein
MQPLLFVCCHLTDHTKPGCILGELLNGKPIFPGSSTMNQLDRIMEFTGRPSHVSMDYRQHDTNNCSPEH